MWTQGTSHLYCCAFASSPASTHHIVGSEVFEVNSQGHPSATFIARATMASAHGAARRGTRLLGRGSRMEGRAQVSAAR